MNGLIQVVAIDGEEYGFEPLTVTTEQLAMRIHELAILWGYDSSRGHAHTYVVKDERRPKVWHMFRTEYRDFGLYYSATFDDLQEVQHELYHETTNRFERRGGRDIPY